MSCIAAMSRPIDEAVAQLGLGPLTEESVQQYIAPLFSRVTKAASDLPLPNNLAVSRVGAASLLWSRTFIS